MEQGGRERKKERGGKKGTQQQPKGYAVPLDTLAKRLI